MKKNNTAQKTVLEAQQISKALKEGTEKTLQSLIKEAIADMIDDEDETEEGEVEEPIEDDSFEVQDVETEETPDDEQPEEGSEEDEPEGEDAEDEWSDMEDYKVGDNDYDFTGVDGDTALKVYNKLGDDDQIYVQKQEDGTYEVKDNETGAEFVIELDPEGGEEDADADVDLDIDLDDEEPEDDTEIEMELDGEETPEEDSDEIEIDLDDETEPESEEELNEELGYTTQYQHDVLPQAKMNTSLKPGTREIGDNALPKGTERQYGKRGDDKPFEKKVNEGCKEGCTCGKKKYTCCEEELEEAAARTSVKKSHMIKGNKKKPEGFPARGPQATLTEAKARKILEAAKAIQAENKQYQNVINEIKKSLYEAAVLNTNYGKIVNLLVNETTTKEEKKSIVERFNNVKTINEGKQLYESIKRELNESNKKSLPMIDEQISIEPSKTINETKIFNDPSINLMERMDNLFKKPMK